MSDLPNFDGFFKRRLRRWALFAVVLIALSAMAMAEGIHIGTVDGVDVQASFIDETGIGPSGEILYPAGQRVNYRVYISNRGSRSLSRVEAQASLHSEGGTCGPSTLSPGSLLPGASLSPVHTTNLSTGDSYEFDVTYEAPRDCTPPAQLKVRLQYQLQGKMHAATLVSPARIRLQ